MTDTAAPEPVQLPTVDFVVVIQETNTYVVKAESEEQIRHWYATEGAVWIERHKGDLVECDDKILDVSRD